MSYQVLARKWRPKVFSTLIGQEHVVRALNHALAEQRLHHAYLFTGTRGVGKTTIARILAKSLNCEQGVSASPCGLCSACTEIDSGRFVDLMEVDAATNTRVDEMRQLLENAVYAPTRGRYKVYVIDEVHMLSNSAFNAMLKTLEEPPEHVKFILATTDPQKIPITVLSRCLQFNLKQMSPPAICRHLSRILEAEGVSFEVGALNLLARSAAGSMRDALSLLDQAIAHGSGRVDEAQVREMLGTVDLDYLYDLIDSLLAGDASRMLAVANGMAERSLSFDAALSELANLLTRVQVAQFAPGAIDDNLPEHDRLLGVAAQMSPEFVQLAYQIAIHGRQDLGFAPDEYAGFCMTLLRLHAFSPKDVALGAPTPVQLPTASYRPVMPVTNTSVKAVSPVRGVEFISHATPTVPQDLEYPKAPMLVVEDQLLDRRSVVDNAEPTTPQLEHQPLNKTASAIASSADWYALLPALALVGMAKELAQNCELLNCEEGLVVLRLSPIHRHLQIKPAQDKVQQALSDHFGRSVQLRIELAETSGATPAVAAKRVREERQEGAVAAIENDVFVRDIIELFADAQVIEASIKPI